MHKVLIPLCARIKSPHKYLLQRNHSIMDTIGTAKAVLYVQVSLIQWLNNTAMYCSGSRTSVLNREMSSIERFHCISLF